MIAEKSLEENGIFILAVTKEAFNSLVARMGEPQPGMAPQGPNGEGSPLLTHGGSSFPSGASLSQPCVTDLTSRSAGADSPAQENGASQPVPAARTLARNTWIFQSNPSYYRLRDALRELREQVWRVSRFKKEIRQGDRVYFWESGPDGGIVGIGELGEAPRVQPHLPEEQPFIREMERFEGDQLRVRVINVRPLETKIPKSYLRPRANLASLSIFRQSRGTNFRVTREEADALEAIIGSYLIAPQSNLPLAEKRIILVPA